MSCSAHEFRWSFAVIELMRGWGNLPHHTFWDENMNVNTFGWMFILLYGFINRKPWDFDREPWETVCVPPAARHVRLKITSTMSGETRPSGPHVRLLHLPDGLLEGLLGIGPWIDMEWTFTTSELKRTDGAGWLRRVLLSERACQSGSMWWEGFCILCGSTRSVLPVLVIRRICS